MLHLRILCTDDAIGLQVLKVWGADAEGLDYWIVEVSRVYLGTHLSLGFIDRELHAASLTHAYGYLPCSQSALVVDLVRSILAMLLSGN